MDSDTLTRQLRHLLHTALMATGGRGRVLLVTEPTAAPALVVSLEEVVAKEEEEEEEERLDSNSLPHMLPTYPRDPARGIGNPANNRRKTQAPQKIVRSSGSDANTLQQDSPIDFSKFSKKHKLDSVDNGHFQSAQETVEADQSVAAAAALASILGGPMRSLATDSGTPSNESLPPLFSEHFHQFMGAHLSSQGHTVGGSPWSSSSAASSPLTLGANLLRNCQPSLGLFNSVLPTSPFSTPSDGVGVGVGVGAVTPGRTPGCASSGRGSRSGNKSFKCNQCNEKFTSLNLLSKHTFAVHRSFRCTICSANFTQRSNLQRHSLKHVGFKPFVCNVCNKAYYRKDHLVRHIEVTHPGVDPRQSITVKLSSSECLDFLERNSDTPSASTAASEEEEGEVDVELEHDVIEPEEGEIVRGESPVHSKSLHTSTSSSSFCTSPPGPGPMPNVGAVSSPSPP